MSRRADLTAFLRCYFTALILMASAFYGHATAMVLLAIVASWLPLQALALATGYTMLRPRQQFWQFWFGDLLCLPTAIYCLSVIWERTADDSWWTSGWWAISCAVIALLAGKVFRLYDRPNYRALQFHGHTKRFHDETAFPALAFMLLLGAPALLWGPWSLGSDDPALARWALGAFCVWLVLMPVDMWRSTKRKRRGQPSLTDTAHPDDDPALLPAHERVGAAA